MTMRAPVGLVLAGLAAAALFGTVWLWWRWGLAAWMATGGVFCIG